MNQLPKKKRALISVSDKSHLAILVQSLVERDWEILSTGGSAAFLRENGFPVTDVKDFTSAAEILSGRVKTLHPKIFAGILFDRKQKAHIQQMTDQEYPSIDLVAVNFYPFEEKAIIHGLTPEESIEYIDIGGPSMIRAAAKNFAHVIPLIDPSDYPLVAAQIRDKDAVDISTRRRLAAKVFNLTCLYDHLVAQHLGGNQDGSDQEQLPKDVVLALRSTEQLRYGENPHQKGALYQPLYPKTRFSTKFKLEDLHAGKGLSYNNYIDLDAACRVLSEFEQGFVCAVIKHTNTCGLAQSQVSLLEASTLAWASDPVSAFGSIVGLNTCITLDVAQFFRDKFVECLIAPEISEDARQLLSEKKNLRLLRYIRERTGKENMLLRQTQLGFLGSTEFEPIDSEKWHCVTEKEASKEDLKAMLFAFRVVKNLKSNAIALCKNGQLLAMGAGSTSRIDALKHALLKAEELGHDLRGAVLASDAFFPFADCITLASEKGIDLFVQPGGSVRDNESIAECNKRGLTMVFTETRYFYH